MKTGPVIGIDLGTSNSVVATVENGSPVIIPGRGGHKLLPSMVAITQDGRQLVGNLAKRQCVINAKDTAFAVKRLIGRRFSSQHVTTERARLPYEVLPGPDDEVHVRIGTQTLPVTQICAFILEELKQAANEHLGEEVRNAVITVPAFFTDAQRQATVEAARLAGLEVMRIINEPTAAALAYGTGRKLNRRVAVVDLGGGTLDVTVLSVSDGVFDVLSTGGDTFLGGEDFDQRIIDLVLEELPPATRSAILAEPMALQRLKEAAERAKCELSDATRADINLPFLLTTPEGPFNLIRTVTRAEFEKATADLLERVIKVSKAVLHDANLRPKEMQEVLLVGGMGRMPRVRDACRELFGREPAHHVHPEEAMALGAALQGHNLMEGGAAALLLDVTPHSLGIAVAGGLCRTLVARNTTVPTSARHHFTPARDGQTRAKIVVLQGESPWSDENDMLGEFTLSGLAPGHRGESQIEVQFDISADGIVAVTAAELRTGARQSITVKASRSGLSEIERLKAESPQTSIAEMEQEARSEVRLLIAELEKLRPKVASRITSTHNGRDTLEHADRVLRRAGAAVEDGDLAELRSVRKSLERVAVTFREIAPGWLARG